MKKVCEFYSQYLILPQSDGHNTNYVENHENEIKENAELIQKICDIEKGHPAYKAREIWESMLTTRGSIPWYLLEDSVLKKEKAAYALPYGQDTYYLRKYYYGEEDPKTLQSYHNIGVYLMKYAEYCEKGDICDNRIDIENSYTNAERIFLKVHEIRKKVLGVTHNITKEQYFRELEDNANAEELSFLNVYDRTAIERIFEEGYDNCSAAALESLQYKSNACYLISQKSELFEVKKEKLDEAVRLSDIVTVARSFLFGPYHRKTLESMRYSAEYYWAKRNKEMAGRRIRYAFGHLNQGQISGEQYKEYKHLFDIITTEK